ncbi:MAG: anaerobic ribonucleoside-triphosphate reductase activating protein [Spartobacteria bacterium]|nr:anaerobic ribonucleoside-triphosphate reductase activating protein [Spartobacteria bacterium]
MWSPKRSVVDMSSLVNTATASAVNPPASSFSPVYGFQKNPSMVDYEGQLSAIFFTSGCNFQCGFCHNAALIGKQQKHLTWDTLKSACVKFKKNWVNAAVISGGEPTLWSQLPQLVEYFHSLGWRVKLDTNGSNPAMLAQVIDQVDYIAMDIKTAPLLYDQLVHYQQMNSIKASAQLIIERARDYEFRTTVLGDHHTPEVVRQAVTLIPGAKKYVLQAFLPRENLPDPHYRTLARTEMDILTVLADAVRDLQPGVMIR